MQALYSQAERKFLLKLARDSIGSILNGSRLSVDGGGVSAKLKEKRGVFVTLMMGGQLRGCIGSLEAKAPLFRGVAENAERAAFSDPRFIQLRRSELDRIKIEISVLSPMKRLDYESSSGLLNYLGRNKPGVYIRRGFSSATYLPQVWEHFSAASEFLGSLCEKAGLDYGEWKSKELDVFVYSVEHFSE